MYLSVILCPHRTGTYLQNCTVDDKSKRANLKTEVTRKIRTPNFPKNENFLPSYTRTYAYEGVKNVSF